MDKGGSDKREDLAVREATSTTIDLYSSVRHFYLKRREQMIEE